MVQRWPGGEGSRVQYHQCHTRSIALWFQKSCVCWINVLAKRSNPAAQLGLSGELSFFHFHYVPFTLFLFSEPKHKYITAEHLHHAACFASFVSARCQSQQSLSWSFWQVYSVRGWSPKPHPLLYWWSVPFQRFPCCFRFPPRWGSIGLTEPQGSLYCCPVTVLG